jgi:hypothetical protein
MLAFASVATPCLFPSPPADATGALIARVAELALRARLRSASLVEVDVRSNAFEILSGRVQGVGVRGTAWRTPLDLSCSALNFDVGATEVDLPAVVAKQRILLKRPATGEAVVSFSGSDWASFLAHPLVSDAVTRAKLPVSFGRDGAKVSADAVEFVARWRDSGAEDVVRLSQAPSQPVVGVAAGGDDAEAAARASSLAEFFGSIRLDLDGCELTFRSMAVRRQLLEVTLDVCVRRFPNPMTINF